MGWVEGCRIARENESMRVIPQQKEHVIPPPRGAGDRRQWRSWSTPIKGKKPFINP
jgi:hypothetical protein